MSRGRGSGSLRRREFLAGAAAVAATRCRFGEGGTGTGTGTPPRVYGSYTVERSESRPGAPNILMIVLDDQNDWLGYLNPHPGTLTPNIDALAERSIVFAHAYCTAPKCRPSRTATLFGRMPHVTDVYDHDPVSRDRERAFVRATPSFVDDLWATGYNPFGTGKVFASALPERWTDYHSTRPWAQKPSLDTKNPWDPEWVNPYTGEAYGAEPVLPPGAIDFGPSGLSDSAEPDGVNVDWARGVLAAQHRSPFFLACGFIQPHLPWRVPQRFFDMHPLDEVVVPDHRPEDLDDLGPYALSSIVDSAGSFRVLRDYELLEEAVQAFQAATSFTDWCVGQLLDELAASPYANDTAVVLWSDQGFHLGEKLHVHKMTLWERACRVPLLISLPGQDYERRVDEPVSLIDIGPTVAAIAGAPMHAPQDGIDLMRKADDPSLGTELAPITTWLEGNHSVRTKRWRYIRYHTGEEELYDHTVDPDEYDNLAGDDQHADIKRELALALPVP